MTHTGTEDIALTGEEEKALHNVMTISTIVFIAMAMLLFGIIASPSQSPVAAIADWDGDGCKNKWDAFPRNPYESVDSDGDGVGDNADEFPDDPYESSDSDGDGFGDNEDFYDEGDARLRISLESFVFIDYYEDHVQTSYYPNAWFIISLDLDCDGDYEASYSSTVFNATKSLSDFFSITVDVEDNADSVRFLVVAYDVTLSSTNDITDYEVIDYNPALGVRTTEHTVSLPCDQSWSSDGEGDDDLPDCYLEYRAETVDQR